MLSGKFDGRAFAAQKLQKVEELARAWAQDRGRPLTLQSIFPFEDDASVLYTKLKQKDAVAAGMLYVTEPLSLKQEARTWREAVLRANHNRKVDGILVQKPSTAAFIEKTGQSRQQFFNWWSGIAEAIDPAKDVDGLQPLTLMDLAIEADRVERGKDAPAEVLNRWILPATAQAVIDIACAMVGGTEHLRTKKVAMVGRSVIVGQPAAAGFRILGVETDLLAPEGNLDLVASADIVVLATGKADFLRAEQMKDGAFLIDVGAPKPEFHESCYAKAQAWTPVPFGVGPVTRACLLENVLKLQDK